MAGPLSRPPMKTAVGHGSHRTGQSPLERPLHRAHFLTLCSLMAGTTARPRRGLGCPRDQQLRCSVPSYGKLVNGGCFRVPLCRAALSIGASFVTFLVT